jgi:hypothetical protein
MKRTDTTNARNIVPITPSVLPDKVEVVGIAEGQTGLTGPETGQPFLATTGMSTCTTGILRNTRTGESAIFHTYLDSDHTTLLPTIARLMDVPLEDKKGRPKSMEDLHSDIQTAMKKSPDEFDLITVKGIFVDKQNDPKGNHASLVDFVTELGGKKNNVHFQGTLTSDKCIFDTRNSAVITEFNDQNYDFGPYGDRTTFLVKDITGKEGTIYQVRDALHPQAWQETRQEHITQRLAELVVYEGLKESGVKPSPQKQEELVKSVRHSLESLPQPVLQSDALQQEVVNLRDYKYLRMEIKDQVADDNTHRQIDVLKRNSLAVQLVGSVAEQSLGIKSELEKKPGILKFLKSDSLDKKKIQHFEEGITTTTKNYANVGTGIVSKELSQVSSSDLKEATKVMGPLVEKQKPEKNQDLEVETKDLSTLSPTSSPKKSNDPKGQQRN